MMRFAALLEALPKEPNAWADYQAEVPAADMAAAHALLTGRCPRRIVGLEALLHWSAEMAGVPDWLMQAALAASGDKAEVAALLLPPPSGQVPGLAEVVDRLTRTTSITAHATLASLWQVLPPPASVVLNRLASGTFRTRFPAQPAAVEGLQRTLRAVMVMADPLRAEVTLALWDQGQAVPVARALVPPADRGDLMGWVRAHATGRFGPLWQVPPLQVVDLTFAGLTPNKRRKCRYDLLDARITHWHRDLAAASADPLAVLDVLAGAARDAD